MAPKPRTDSFWLSLLPSFFFLILPFLFLFLPLFFLHWAVSSSITCLGPGFEPCMTLPATQSFNMILGTPYSVAARLMGIVPSPTAFNAPSIDLLLHWRNLICMLTALQLGGWSQTLRLPHILQSKATLAKIKYVDITDILASQPSSHPWHLALWLA